jgi:hypothetical protein
MVVDQTSRQQARRARPHGGAMQSRWVLRRGSVLSAVWLLLPALVIHAQTTSPTKIDDIVAFLNRCPTSDPAYAQIRKDFVIRLNGQVVGDVPCSEPYPAMPIAQLTNELVALQAFRVAYYMDPGGPNYLPWTSKTLYHWLASVVGGIDMKTRPGQFECCETYAGRRYIVQSTQPDNQREYKREWPGIAATLAFFVHEARHADDGPPHTTGCVAFRNASGPPGCDRSYNVQKLGSYGVQYWLNQSWMTGRLNVGIACSPNAERYARQHLLDLNLQFRNRFVENVPPLETLPAPPYGGKCFAQRAEASKPGIPPQPR